MKCLKKSKYCTPAKVYRAKNDNYICCGISNKPSKHKDDTVWLCLNGFYCRRRIEMTGFEAAIIADALCHGIGLGEKENVGKRKRQSSK